MEKKTCMDAALSKLEHRMRTEKELFDFLISEEYNPIEINEVMSQLKKLNYIDDSKYAIEFFEYAKSKKWADRRIVFELQNKGIDSELSKSIIEEYKNSSEYVGVIDDDQVALGIGIGMANEHISMGKTMDEKFYAKVGRRLQGLGYSQRTCYYVIDRLRTGGKAKKQEMEAIEQEKKKKETEALYYIEINKQ